MSNDEKEVRKQSELRFAGQDSDEARAAVKAQRELKKKRDALRKVQKELKTLNAEADTAAMREAAMEMQELQEAIAHLGGIAEPSHADPSVPAISDSPSPSPLRPTLPPAQADEAPVNKEARKQSELRFAGQDSDEARAAVKAQRELKKKRDALRKVQKELKAANAAASPDHAAQLEKERTLMSEIAGLEVICGDSSSPSPTAATSVRASPPKSHVAAAATANKAAPAPAAAPMPAAEREFAEKRLRDMLQRAIDLNRLERRHLEPCQGVVHPRVAEVAILMEKMLLVGGSARVLALISAFREVIRATTVLAVPSLNEVDTTAFEKLMQANFDFIRRKREASAGMRYVKDVLVRRFVALRDEVIHPKPQVAALINDLGNPREVTLQMLDMIESELKMSFKSIVEDRSLPYVSSTDTILVFGRSSIVEYILLSRARDAQCKPKAVIVVDAAPLFEGRQLADKLSSAGIEVTYCLITACCTLMPRCTRVFLGASAVLQNGDVFGRCGMALVAACARLFRKPVLCFSESYKFVPEVWVGNLAQNTKLADMRPPVDAHAGEGGGHSPLGFPSPPTLSPPQLRASVGEWGTPNRVGDFFSRSGADLPFSSSASGYLYDLTPASHVDMIVCEMGCLHTTAIVAAIKDREGREESQLAYLVRN